MEGLVVTDPVPVVEEPEIPSDATTGPRPAEPMASNGIGRGDGSATSCPWSLTHEQQVLNLKENWKNAFNSIEARINFGNNYETNPWFARVVEKLRVNPCLDSCELKIDESLLGGLVSGVRMTSLDLAILMGDLKMVQNILESNFDSDNAIYGQVQDLRRAWQFLQLSPIFDTHTKTGILYTPLHVAVGGGDSHIVDALLEKGADVNAQNWLYQTPLDLACRRQDVRAMVGLGYPKRLSQLQCQSITLCQRTSSSKYNKV